MLIVAIDTSGKSGSVGVFGYNAGSGGVVVSGCMETLAGGTYSSDLIPKLTELLSRDKHNKGDIEAFVVASGPGSFTGLRVGLSTVKALADALNKPIAAVSVLEAVASFSTTQGRILVALDAGRKQVYVGEFEIVFASALHLHPCLEERLLDLVAFVEELTGKDRTVYTPDVNIHEALRPTGSSVTLIPPPLADRYALLGAKRILAGQVITPAELDANYIRRSDAEIFFKGPK